MGGFASSFKKNFLYTYQVCMFPEKHQGTLREHMSCGVQLSAQPSIYIYIYIYIYISQQSMFWRNSWVLGIPTSHILTACKPIYIRCWFRVVAKIYISTRDVSPKNEGTIGLWGTPALYIYICFCLEKIYPWRHSNCWLPNSFILGGGGHSRFWNAGKMQFSSFAV